MKREFAHSISRIIDRFDQLEKDCERIERNVKDLRQDINKSRTALESFFNDFLKGIKDETDGKV